MKERNPVVPLAAFACYMIFVLSLCGALGTYLVGDVSGRLAAADTALRTLEDTAEQRGASVCIGGLINDSCNIGQQQEKAGGLASKFSDGDTSPYEWLVVGCVGCFFIILAASVSYRIAPDLW